jgi:hypothetical protein
MGSRVSSTAEGVSTHAIVLGVQPHDLTAEKLIWQRSTRYLAVLGRALSAGRDEFHLRYTHSAGDELDPKAIPHHVDEDDHFDRVRPSSVANNTLADQRISFAFSSSVICFFNRLIFTGALWGRSWPSAGHDLGTLAPHPQRFRIDPEPTADMASGSKMGWVIGSCFGRHPQRTRMKIGRAGFIVVLSFKRIRRNERRGGSLLRM